MPRYQRVVVVDCAHHVTQRGNQRGIVFDSDEDREVYLDLVKNNASDCHVSILGYSLMPNHVHWIVTPRREDSLATAFGRAHCRYSNYFQARRRTTGHLSQNRFYSCPLGVDQLVRAMRYVEQNPVRAGLAREADDYRWSSAWAHLGGRNEREILDLHAWEVICGAGEWRDLLKWMPDGGEWKDLERCTFGGKPFGGEAFRREISLKSGRDLTPRGPGRPKKPMDAPLEKLANC
jgi:putative transposase